MTNTELTLDQLQTISGGATAIEYGLIAAFVPNPDKVELDKSPSPLRNRFAVAERNSLNG